MKRFVQGLSVLILWMAVGLFVSAMMYESLFMTMLGGNYSPPVIWRIARDFGLVVMPVLLVFGGLPLSIQLWRGRPWRRVFLISLGTCLLSVAVVIFVVFYGPGVFGWWW